MYNLDDFFIKTTKNEHQSLNSGNGIIYDIKMWSNAYRKYLVDSGKSLNTSALYNVTLNALQEYAGRSLSDLEDIGSIGISHLNGFLEWMEEYQTSKRYGGIKERVELLIRFLSTKEITSVAEYERAMSVYFEDMNDDEVDINQYVLEDFLMFYRRSISPIGKDLIKAYIDSRPKVSISTMNQRRIALVAFLGFIDKAIGEDKFGSNVWQLKQYRMVKKVNQLCTGFSVSDEKKIRESLLVEPKESISMLKKLQKDSEYCEWRNRAMMVLMMEAGLRTSEALRLRFTDVTEISGRDTSDKEGYMLKVLGKGNKERRVPIAKSLFEPYFRYLSENKRGEYLSSTESGRPTHRTNLFNAVRFKLIAAGVSRGGLHIFRHHFGSSFAARDGNMKVLQQLLGHSNITTTMIYSEIDDEVLARAVIK